MIDVPFIGENRRLITFGILLIAVLGAFLIWYFFQKPLTYWRKIGVKQSRPLIFFGDSWRLLTPMTLNDFMSTLYNMFPKARYAGFYNFTTPVLIVRDPELIKQMMVKDFEHFTDHVPFVHPDSDPIWSNSLISLKGERWKEMREVLSPTFTSSKMKNIYNLMLETADNLVQHFLEKTDDIIDLDTKDCFSRFSSDIISNTAFGVNVNSFKDQDNPLFKMGDKLTQFKGHYLSFLIFYGHHTFPKLFKYLHIPFLDRTASKYFYKVIRGVIKEREEQNVSRQDMIHLMLDARKNYTGESGECGDKRKTKAAIPIPNKEIIAQTAVFYFAGFENVSIPMCYGAYELALNKDVQDKLRKEIYENQKDGKITYENLMQMKYMNMVVSEVFRKWPPFPSMDRVCTKPYTIKPINEREKLVSLPVNQEIWLPVFGLHRDPKYYPDPEKFDPERFSDENKHKLVPYTYMPFGVGPRTCIGNRMALLEMKTLYYSILLNFEIVPTKKTPIPLVLSKEFNQLPKQGLWVGLKPIRS